MKSIKDSYGNEYNIEIGNYGIFISNIKKGVCGHITTTALLNHVGE